MGIGSWLGLWFGLSIPAILAMYLLKRKFIDTKVPSHLLWQRVMKNLEANRPWQKLQNRLLLWLQLLVAAVLVFALMKPYWWAPDGGKGHVVLVADTSGSMGATISTGRGETAEESLGQMKRMIKDYLRQEAKDSDITLLSMNAEPNVVISREKDRSRALEAVDSLQIYYGRAAYDETLSLASALTRDETDAEVVVFTDGQWRGNPDSIPFHVPVKVMKTDAHTGSNLALQQFGVKDGADGKTAVAVVNNGGGAAKEANVNMYGDGKLLQTETARMKPGETVTLTFRNVPDAEVYRAELEGQDDYAADNEAYAFLQRNESPRILLLTRGNLFLEKALQLTGAEVVKMTLTGNEGGASVSGEPGTAVAAVPENAPNLIVIDGQTPSFAAQGDWQKLIDRTPVWTVGGSDGKMDVSGGQPKLENHPVNRYASYNGVYIGSLLNRPLPDWATPIVSIDGHPAVIAGTANGQLRLSFLFDLEDTDFPLSAEFPIVVHEAVSWLTGSGGKNLGRHTAGTRVEIPIAADTVSARWIAKDGLAQKLKVPEIKAEAGEKGINALQQMPPVPGLYVFEQQNREGQTTGYFAESSADPFEVKRGEPNAKLAAIGQAADGNGTAASRAVEAAAANSGGERRQMPLVTLLSCLALLIILVEWGVYQRGRSI
ncbi:VWA domain-containing protein [Paenibacillus sp. VCA1]|uniref:vWA domain-containing protein n=1 Tax=Paenibacillus sp. VCA1 TaxID=3039148 RepID=UPI002871FA14|nr:VWA domain-containing protein [Paenibacillus sp. VCA1]MDR9856140.1 VWA domain-containing protein [Paenibacillus sp. VCA1]